MHKRLVVCCARPQTLQECWGHRHRCRFERSKSLLDGSSASPRSFHMTL